MRTIEAGDFHFEIRDEDGDKIILCRLDGMNRLEGFIEEFDTVTLSPSEIIQIAKWLLGVAADRAYNLEDEHAYCKP